MPFTRSRTSSSELWTPPSSSTRTRIASWRPTRRAAPSSASRVHPGELAQLTEFVDGALRDGHRTTVVLTCRIGTGNCLPIEMSLHAFDGSGGTSHLLALVIDRSEHRRPPA